MLSTLMEKDWAKFIRDVGFPIIAFIVLALACKVYWLDPLIQRENKADAAILKLVDTVYDGQVEFRKNMDYFRIVAEENRNLIKENRTAIAELKELLEK